MKISDSKDSTLQERKQGKAAAPAGTITSEMVILAVKQANANAAGQIQRILDGPPETWGKMLRALKNSLLSPGPAPFLCPPSKSTRRQNIK